MHSFVEVGSLVEGELVENDDGPPSSRRRFLAIVASRCEELMAAALARTIFRFASLSFPYRCLRRPLCSEGSKAIHVEVIAAGWRLCPTIMILKDHLYIVDLLTDEKKRDRDIESLSSY